jgi:hypothetical protein
MITEIGERTFRSGSRAAGSAPALPKRSPGYGATNLGGHRDDRIHRHPAVRITSALAMFRRLLALLSGPRLGMARSQPVFAAVASDISDRTLPLQRQPDPPLHQLLWTLLGRALLGVLSDLASENALGDQLVVVGKELLALRLVLEGV